MIHPGFVSQPVATIEHTLPSEIAREVRLFANRALGRVEPFRRRAELRPIVSAFDGLDVLEIGGPSAIFMKGSLVPVYDVIAGHDAANYASSTLWESERASPRPRREFVAEATALGCPEGAYEGLLASHVIEHSANPLGALAEWRRVVARGGPLLIVIPHKDATFDHRRETTSLAHMREDERIGMREDDISHVPEVLAHHDPRHDFFDGSAEDFEQRCWENARYRALHHHVFTTLSAVNLLEAAGLEVVHVVPSRPHHIVILARQPRTTDATAPRPRTLNDTLRKSPFVSDRRAA